MPQAGLPTPRAFLRALGAALAAPLALASVVGPLPAQATPPAEPTDSFVFRPAVDAYVDAAQPGTTFGASSSLRVDAKSVKQMYMRFDLRAIEGRSVRGVRLRMYQTDSSAVGGRVSSLSSTDWTEAVTWATRPVIDGPQLASFGGVASKRWYEVDLGPIASSNTPLALAVDSPSADGATWSSRHSARPPMLIVDLEPVDGVVLDGISEVAPAHLGSSDPTYYPSNHRLALTSGRRLLAVHGLHAQGVQLAWRNPGGGWQTDTRGDVPDGRVLSGAGTGDRSASIAVGRDSAGTEHAWVVWSAVSLTKARNLLMRRISELDDPAGPLVGPIVTLDSPALGTARPDIGFEAHADGTMRAVVCWTRRVGPTSYELVAKWLTSLDTDTPALHGERVLVTATTSRRTGTVEPAPTGVRVIAKGAAGRLAIHGHDSADPPTDWWSSPRGVAMSSSSYPSGVVLDSGDTLAVTESNTTNNVVTVQRFTNGSVTTELVANGYEMPALASDGTDAWLVMIRVADGFIVTRRFRAGIGWDAPSDERVEIGIEGGGNYAYPSVVRRTDGRLRILTRGPRGGNGSGSQNAVLGYQRIL